MGKATIFFVIVIIIFLALFLPFAAEANAESLVGSAFEQGCFTGYLTEHRSIESVHFIFPERKKPFVDGYIGVENLNQLGRYYILRANGKSALVYAADKLNENHREAHDALWQGTWAADVNTELLKEMGWPNYGTLCKIEKPTRRTHGYQNRLSAHFLQSK